MNNYLVLGTCFLLGIVLRRSGRLPDNAAVALNGFLVHISLPALILAYVHELHLDARLILPALMPWILFGLGCGYFWLVGKALGFSPATIGGLMLTGGLANTAFIGLPMIEAFYGSEFLGLGILIDQVGSYLVLSTVGILVASIYSSGQSLDAKAIIRRIVLFVPFQATIVSAPSLRHVSIPTVGEDQRRFVDIPSDHTVFRGVARPPVGVACQLPAHL